MLSEQSNSVCPSGSARATASVPILVAAPPRFSTPTCWPQISESLPATTRAIASVPPPGGNGTTSRTKRVGQPCADARLGSAGAAIEAAVSAMARRRLSMGSLVDLDAGRPDDGGPLGPLGLQMR